MEAAAFGFDLVLGSGLEAAAAAAQQGIFRAIERVSSCASKLCCHRTYPLLRRRSTHQPARPLYTGELRALPPASLSANELHTPWFAFAHRIVSLSPWYHSTAPTRPPVIAGREDECGSSGGSSGAEEGVGEGHPGPEPAGALAVDALVEVPPSGGPGRGGGRMGVGRNPPPSSLP